MGIYSDTGLLQETRRISNKQLNLPSKSIRKRRINKAQSQQMEKIIKIREEINKIEAKN